MRRYLPLLVALLIVASAPASASAASVSIDDNFFSPATVTLSPGGSVTWTNNGDRDHTVTATKPYMRYFDSEREPGQTFTRAFTAAGGYTYLCVFHSGMTGTVRVKTLASPASGSASTNFTVRVASAAAPSGHRYVIQMRKNDGAWAIWRRVTTATTVFDPSSAGRYQFRSALERASDGAKALYSPAATVTVS